MTGTKVGRALPRGRYGEERGHMFFPKATDEFFLGLGYPSQTRSQADLISLLLFNVFITFSKGTKVPLFIR